MNLKSMHVFAAVPAFAILSLIAAPVSAQARPAVAFEQVRDTGRRFFSGADTRIFQIRSSSESNRGAGGFKACAPTTSPVAPTPCTITRVAMDTLSFVVRPPDRLLRLEHSDRRGGHGLDLRGWLMLVDLQDG